MYCFHALPGTYRESLRIDLQKDKRLAVAVNLAAGLLMVVLLVLGNVLFVPVLKPALSLRPRLPGSACFKIKQYLFLP